MHQPQREVCSGKTMSGQRYTVAFMLVALLASSTLAAPVLADVEWENDGWLTTALADERLALGDEFGCYGMPGYSWYNDPGLLQKNAAPTLRTTRTLQNGARMLLPLMFRLV